MQISLFISGRLHSMQGGVLSLEMPPDAGLDDVLNAVPESHRGPAGWAPSALLSVSGKHVGTIRNHQACRLHDGDEILVFSPVAGG